MIDEHLRPLSDIHAACLAIQPLISNRSRVEFILDKAAMREVRRNLRNIRRAAKSVSQKSRDRYPTVHWERLSAVQIVFFHEYYGIDVDAIWVIFQKTINLLAEELGMIQNINNPSRKIENA